MSDQKTELKRRIQTMLWRMAEKMMDGDTGRVIAHGADAVADMVQEDLGPAGEEASRAEKELIADTGSTYGGQAHQLLQVATCSSTRRCTPAPIGMPPSPISAGRWASQQVGSFPRHTGRWANRTAKQP
jgi:hypothetical protein